ncbi:MAG: hypothetical protein IKO80_02510 [Lachnospiraceae bacterium]|nr:hypothetical protein [Lachnospiraceae bacterium]
MAEETNGRQELEDGALDEVNGGLQTVVFEKTDPNAKYEVFTCTHCGAKLNVNLKKPSTLCPACQKINYFAG